MRREEWLALTADLPRPGATLPVRRTRCISFTTVEGLTS